MCIFLNNAMLSIVAHRDKPDILLVRARVKGDIEAAFPGITAHITPGADYRFRAEIPRARVALFLQQHVQEINYPNFKKGVKDKVRRAWYSRVWESGHSVQQMGALGYGPTHL